MGARTSWPGRAAALHGVSSGFQAARSSQRTPPETLHAARAIAREAGLHYVYEGNIYSEAAHTSCPSCGTLLIRRSWHDVQKNQPEERLLPEMRPGDSWPLGKFR